MEKSFSRARARIVLRALTHDDIARARRAGALGVLPYNNKKRMFRAHEKRHMACKRAHIGAQQHSSARAYSAQQRARHDQNALARAGVAWRGVVWQQAYRRARMAREWRAGAARALGQRHGYQKYRARARASFYLRTFAHLVAPRELARAHHARA